MVAYSFAPQFIEPIASRQKLQTVRAQRRRHARVGEAIQLYTAMRTKQCRKLIDVDPICVGLMDIRIIVDPGHCRLISDMAIDGHHRTVDEMEAFARADGFADDDEASALRRMGEFWVKAHKIKGDFFRFDGVCIRWGWPQ